MVNPLFGKSANVRIAHNTYMPQHVKVRQQMVPQRGIFDNGHCCGGNTNITVNNGPTGFWGFMSGMMGGLFGGGMMGNMFGGNLFGMNMGMGMSPYGALNNAQMQPQANQPQDKLAQLKTLYPNHNIVSDGNGKYSATDKDGNLIGQGLSYEDMCKALAKQPEPKKTETEKKNEDPLKAKPDPTQGDDPGNKPVKPTNQKAVSAEEFLKGDTSKGFTVHDEELYNKLGQSADIKKNNYSISDSKSKEGYPTEITVGKFKYKFVKVGDDGAAIYQSVNGKGDQYKLEKNSDGTFALNQYGDMQGVGTADNPHI